MNTIIRDRVGLVSWPNRHVPTYGMAPATDPNQPLMWTVNCVIRHTAEIDGVAYFGAGTKIFDDLVLGEALKSLTSPAGRRLLTRSSAADDLAARANDILTRHHHDRIDSLTRARSTAFAASHVELYMRPHGGRMPANDEVGRGDVKVPPLWHTAAKAQAGRWRRTEAFAASSRSWRRRWSWRKIDRSRRSRRLSSRQSKEFETVVRHPGRRAIRMRSIERWRPKAGRSSTRKSAAHAVGVYDGRGNVVWPGRHEDVGTDRGRLDVVNAAFVEAFGRARRLARPPDTQRRIRGYAAPVWANYPYLHNGSVPTLHHLLGPASERPKIFNVMAARRFDRQRVGQPLYPDERSVWLDEAALIGRYGERRDWFNASREGCDNSGHDVWRRIRTDARRRALIEYLKTL